MENQDSTNSFQVNLDQFNGPLDLLLDLAKSQKVNLENISITLLADQFLEYINKVKDINLDIASEYLVMATWLAYLKSKLLLPITDEEEFKVHEVAERLKLQLKKLELIRLLSDQMLKRKRLGKDIFVRGIKGRIRSIYSSTYKLSLYELLKTYSAIVMQKDFQRMNIPKLPVCTTEEGIKLIKSIIKKLEDWKNLEDIIPKKIDVKKILKKLEDIYKNRGINLVCISNKWSFRTASNLSSLMSKQKTVEKKLSKAAIETLSIIVYHQPVTRAEIEEIRGVAFGTNTIDILMELNWVKPMGRKEIPGKPIQYGTTEDFLSHFNLQKLSDLPTVDELGSAGLIDSSTIDSSIFGTGKFYKEKQDEKKENIYSNIDEMLNSTLNDDAKE